MKKIFNFETGRPFCCSCTKYCKVIEGSSSCCKSEYLITYCPLTEEQRKDKIFKSWEYE